MDLSGLKEFLSQFDSAETRRAYRRDIDKFFKFAKKSPVQVTKIHILNYLEYLKTLKISANSISRMFCSIRSYFKFLFSMEVIDKNPETLFSINMPTIHRKEEDDISNENVMKILKEIKSSRDFAIVSFMLYNGLRRSEICNMKFGDIDKKDKTNILNIIGKGDKLRTVVIHKVSWIALMKYLKDSGKIGNQKKDSYIFTTIHGKKLCGNDIYNVIKKYAAHAGLSKIHPHMFRAKYASMAIEAGVPITSVQYTMGHASIETTAIYDHAKRSVERGKEVSKGIKEIQ